jgi:pimeloyl-ACP methyl ester carboxylesterase
MRNRTDQHERIVFVHGITGSRRFFASLEKRLRSGPNTETLSFDLPGFGSNKNVTSSYTVDDQLRFMSDVTEKRFPFGQLTLIGHSLGGLLALAWAVDHLARTSRIVLLNTPLAETRDDIVRAISRERLSWAGILLNHRRLAHLACIIFRRFHLMSAFRFAKPVYVPDDVFHDYTEHNWNSLVETFDHVLLNVPGIPLIRRIRTVPILNLIGSEDEDFSRRTVDQANVRNVAIPGGHLMLLEHPYATAQPIEQFLSETRTIHAN